MKHNKRHMVNLTAEDYKKIQEYCKPRNIIVSKWIATACAEKINEIISGSAGNNGKQLLHG